MQHQDFSDFSQQLGLGPASVSQPVMENVTAKLIKPFSQGQKGLFHYWERVVQTRKVTETVIHVVMFWLKFWFHGLLLKFLQQIFHQTLLCQTVQSETPRYVFCFAVFGRSLQQHIGFIKRALLQIDFFACFLKSFIKLFLFPSKIILVRLKE